VVAVVAPAQLVVMLFLILHRVQAVMVFKVQLPVLQLITRVAVLALVDHIMHLVLLVWVEVV
jgi:hypothetical protein